MIFKLNRKVEKGERNDKVTRKSKSKAFLKSISLNAQHRIYLTKRLSKGHSTRERKRRQRKGLTKASFLYPFP